MALSQESYSYIIDALGASSGTPGKITAGQEVINAINTPATLSAPTYQRLQDAFGDPLAASVFQAAILGSQPLDLRTAQFVKCGFSAPLSVLTSIFATISGGVASNVKPGYL